MKQVVIENPFINSPFVEPKRHFKFTDEGITNEVVEKRRVSSYFIRIAKPKKKGKQLILDTEWTQDRIEENKFVNEVRAKVEKWRQGGHVGVTKTTGQFLDYWLNPQRDKKLFFCQVEAVNNHGGFGHWEFTGISEPWDAANTIRASLTSQRSR